MGCCCWVLDNGAAPHHHHHHHHHTNTASSASAAYCTLMYACPPAGLKHKDGLIRSVSWLLWMIENSRWCLKMKIQDKIKRRWWWYCLICRVRVFLKKALVPLSRTASATHCSLVVGRLYPRHQGVREKARVSETLNFFGKGLTQIETDVQLF